MSVIDRLDNHINIIDLLEWTDPFFSLDSYLANNTKYWARSDINPSAGQQRLLLINGYKDPDNNIEILLDRDYYFLFQPAMSSINGYDEEYKEEIDNFFIVNATIKNQVYRISELWYLIEINSVINLADFQSLIKTQAIAPEVFKLKTYLQEYLDSNFRLNFFRYKNWLNIFFDEEMWYIDLFFWHTENKLILVFIYEYRCRIEQAFITNYTISDREYELINLALENPELLTEKRKL